MCDQNDRIVSTAKSIHTLGDDPQGIYICLLYTSDAADERSSVDLGGRRIIKKKNTYYHAGGHIHVSTTCNNRLNTH